MKKKRIVITGMGIVSCFGNEVDDYFQSLLDGKSGASLITSFPCEDYPTRIAASIKNFESGDYIDKKQARRIDKNIAYALVAGKKALEASQLSPEVIAKLNKERCGVVIGSGMGEWMSTVKAFRRSYKKASDGSVLSLCPIFLPTWVELCLPWI
ncbi:3-oxoacyl-[acyl-carrier-protein] synthase 2 (plasmid) [Neochlamydia sp. S13]|nr:3-oxoacyl-[acyl-carrier-protein] synthase 2 [Neochlamydia sp. S13]